jgi:hypothetical protein
LFAHIKGGTRLRLLKNRLLRRIFGHKRGKVSMEWKKLNNEKLHDLLFSSNVIQLTKSRTTDGLVMWHLCREEWRIQGWWGNVRERDHWADLGLGERILFEWISGIRKCGYGLDQAGSG